MTLTRRSLAAALALAPLGRSLAQPTAARAQAAPLPVLATFSILGDVVRAVGGAAIALEVLVGPDSDAHTFEPSPDDLTRIAEAAVLVENGVGFEPWLDDVYAAAEARATRVVATAGMMLLDADGQEHTGEDDDQQDPHVWHDVARVMTQVATVRDALSAADPANAETFRANAEAYLVQLAALHADVLALASTLPPERRRLVTSHDALGYLAVAYGFELVGTALGSFSTETADPSGGEMAALVEEIRDAGVPAIFAENIEGTDLMRQIADDAGVALAPRLYTDALGEPGGEAGTYLALVRHNMTTIVAALGVE